MPRKIILDCDPGHDDAIAILLAHGCPEIDLLAITTVAGNQTLDKTTLNARRVCTVAGITDVPIAAGCPRPLLRQLETAPHIHGESGLDGPVFAGPTVTLETEHAVDLIIDLVMDSGGDITLVPTGPLTNIALALRKQPRLVEQVQEVVLMGGAYTRGNTTPAAEFNIYVDPEAADIVFSAGLQVTMVGLDLTHQALASPEVLDRISAIGSPVSRMVVDLMRFYREAYWRSDRLGDPPVHDPCAVAYVARPELFETVRAHVAIETNGALTRGMTVVDFSTVAEAQRNATVATKLADSEFWDLLTTSLERIG